MCRELRALRQSISDYAGRFDVHALVPSQAGEVVRECSRIEASIAAIKALAAAKSAEGTAWKHAGYRSPADQLAQETGMSPGRAKRALETGRRMAEQPEVAEAALAGDLSPEQADAVSDGAAANPDKAKELVDKAKEMSMPELNEEVARTKAAVTDLEARRRHLHENRSFRRYTDQEGAGHAHLFGNPEHNITVWEAIDPIRRHLVLRRRDSDHPRERFEAIDHDALMILASAATGKPAELSITDLLGLGLFPELDLSTLGNRTPNATHAPPGEVNPPNAHAPRTIAPRLRPDLLSGLAGDNVPALADATPRPADLADLPPFLEADPDPPPTQPGSSKLRRKLAGRPVKLVIRVDYDVLLRGYPLEGELCDIPGYGPIAVSLIEDLMATGNVFIAVAFMKALEVKSVYHHGRRPNAYQKTALELIYPECAVKGCNVRYGLQYDHREDWVKTHYTVLDLLDGLCQHHHKLKTHKGWALVEGRGKRDFVPPDDPRHPRNKASRSESNPPPIPAGSKPAPRPAVSSGGP